ncbi:MAG: hypothetical protein KDC18_21025, partial [Alphaproteobacteria bacterium]|nr:hypothetical protein [Alphaproteobacteria bacterium]
MPCVGLAAAEIFTYFVPVSELAHDSCRIEVREFLAARFPVRDAQADDEREDTISRAPDGHDALVQRASDLQRALAAHGLS